MPQQPIPHSFDGSAPENYERYFVPWISTPLAHDLLEVAALRPGERVLDVACGTGIVARLAAAQVGSEGSVAGSDVNPGMLAVARASAAPNASIKFYETGAEAMPLADGAYDVVLCQMGVQFFSNKLASLREMARVLAPGGRLLLNVPGPIPDALSTMAEALARHVAPQVGSFVHIVFSLHDAGEIRELLERAGLHEVDIQAATRTLHLPPPRDFLWQYVNSTPLGEAVARLDAQQRDALERDVCSHWQALVVDGALEIPVRMTTAIARKR